MTDVTAWAEDHKPVVVAGGAALLLLLLLAVHRRRTAQGGDAGPTTQDTGGQYLVPYDGTADSADTSGGAQDLTPLVNAITGLTTTVANLDPVNGTHNDGTDGGGGTDATTTPTGAGPLQGHPIAAKPLPVHHAKHPTPRKSTAKPPPKSAPKKTAKKTAPRAPAPARGGWGVVANKPRALANPGKRRPLHKA